MTLRELHLFAGAGGGILGAKLLGHRIVGAVEINAYCRNVLAARQADGSLEQFPIHDDVTTFDGRDWRGRVDVVAGGFPCQDISTAGKGAGLEGARSGLWWEMHRVIREVEPRYVFVENVAALLVRGFDRVLGSLADLGFDAEWCVLSASDCGAPHLRKRLWLLARHPDRQQQDPIGEARGWSEANATGVGAPADAEREQLRVEPEPFSWGHGEAIAAEHGEVGAAATHPDADGGRCEVQRNEEQAREQGASRREPDRLRHAPGTASNTNGEARGSAQRYAVERDSSKQVVERSPESGRRSSDAAESGGARLAKRQGQAGERAHTTATRGGWWATEPRVGRVAHGVPSRVDRLRALGNAQVPVVAATAWRLLSARFDEGMVGGLSA